MWGALNHKTTFSKSHPKQDNPILKWHGEALKLLIVESDRAFLEELTDTLEQVQTTENRPFLQISCAQCLREAIDILEDRKFDIIITETNLDDASGLLVLEELIEFGHRTPVIVLSNTNSWAGIIDASEPYVVDVILKQTLDIDQLTRSILYSVERRRLEKESNYSTAKFRSLIEMLPLGFCMLDAENKCLYSSKLFEEMLGTDTQKLCEQKLPSVLGAVNEAFVRQSLAQARSTQNNTEIEFSIEKDGGKRSDLLIIANPVSEEDSPAGELLLVCMDQTQRMAVQEERTSTEILQAQNNALSNLANEFNNSMGQILIDAENLRNITELEQRNRPIERIEKSIAELRCILRPMLLSSQEIEPRFETVVSNKFLTGIISEYSRGLPTDIVLESYLEENLPLIKGDSACLKESILNLLENAKESQEGRGIIRFKATSLDISLGDEIQKGLKLPAGNYLQIEIEDAGVGIPSTLKTRVFEPFFSTKNSEHKGMGLANTLKCIDTHRGKLRLESKENVGTSIQVFLPEKSLGSPPEVPDADEQNKVRTPCKASTILLVDDEEDFLSAAEEFLKFLGYKVISASDGAEGLSLFQKHRPEIGLAIVDFTMPVMSGPELIRNLKKIAPSLIILLCTGQETQSALEKTKDLDIAATIFKPFSGNEIQKVLSEFLPNGEKHGSLG